MTSLLEQFEQKRKLLERIRELEAENELLRARPEIELDPAPVRTTATMDELHGAMAEAMARESE